MNFKELFWTIIISLLLLLITLISLIFTMLGRRRVRKKDKGSTLLSGNLDGYQSPACLLERFNFRYLGANRTFASLFRLK